VKKNNNSNIFLLKQKYFIFIIMKDFGFLVILIVNNYI